MLKAGVALYELYEAIKKAVKKKFFWLPGLSNSSLRTKFMMIDRKTMFASSMNLVQRSLNINNEIGILFRNPEIAGQSADALDHNIDNVALRLELHKSSSGVKSILWHVKRSDHEIVYDSEPYASFWKKLGVGLIRLLPVESLF